MIKGLVNKVIGLIMIQPENSVSMTKKVNCQNLDVVAAVAILQLSYLPMFQSQ
ncbi:MAG: hypothetical protein QS721_12375 [Candidatus Endonucleobacter sp. (ex Gigantidas childressi)]|nr:hypothetical protein [Candidatus Endonucleobacter sp. (ex Gigantidas childressi)]